MQFLSIGDFHIKDTENRDNDGRNTILATDCSVISCEPNEECAQVGNIFRCICKPDYRGSDCRLGKKIVFIKCCITESFMVYLTYTVLLRYKLLQKNGVKFR